MSTHHPGYDAYLLRTWQEEPTEESSSPTRYYLIEQLFGERQRWLFSDVTAFHLHLQSMFTTSSSNWQKGSELRSNQSPKEAT